VPTGSIKAREIRGAIIESIGTIRADVGITDTIIRSQGDIHARYLHNCQIETFGNIYIENEIFDSKITVSGKIDSPGCRIISSSLYAKKEEQKTISKKLFQKMIEIENKINRLLPETNTAIKVLK